MIASVLPSVSIIGEANNPYYCLLYLEKTAGQSLGGFVTLQR